jgi:hypothetical protein
MYILGRELLFGLFLNGGVTMRSSILLLLLLLLLLL